MRHVWRHTDGVTGSTGVVGRDLVLSERDHLHFVPISVSISLHQAIYDDGDDDEQPDASRGNKDENCKWDRVFVGSNLRPTATGGFNQYVDLYMRKMYDITVISWTWFIVS